MLLTIFLPQVIASAQTGRGKTGAYALPLLQSLLTSPPPPSSSSSSSLLTPHILILAPTASLAHQITSEIQSLSTGLGIRVASVYDCRKRADILIGTPAKLLSHVQENEKNNKTLDLSHVRTLVLDEW